MTRNVRVARESLRKPWRKRAKARGETFALKLRKLRKWPPSGRPRAAKVADPPRRPLTLTTLQVENDYASCFCSASSAPGSV
eukprot:1471741-Prymnesium_polylepis.1